MIKLIEHNCVKTETTKGKTCIICLSRGYVMKSVYVTRHDEWCNEFLFNYEDPAIGSKLLTVYNRQLNNVPTPIQFDIAAPWLMKDCNNLTMLLFRFNLTRTYPVEKEKYTFKLRGKKIWERYIKLKKGPKDSTSLVMQVLSFG